MHVTKQCITRHKEMDAEMQSLSLTLYNLPIFHGCQILDCIQERYTLGFQYKTMVTDSCYNGPSLSTQINWLILGTGVHDVASFPVAVSGLKQNDSSQWYHSVLLSSLYCTDNVDCVTGRASCSYKTSFIYLWPPYVIGQAIYIFILSFVLVLLFPCLISAVADWMFIILPHMVWP